MWPLYPPVQLPDGYGSEAPKGFLPGMFDSIKGKLIGEPDIVPRPANDMILPRIETDRQLSFEEFSCMLRTRQLCLWEMCRKTARVGTGGKDAKDGAPGNNHVDDANVDLVSVKRTEQLMDEMNRVEVILFLLPSLKGRKRTTSSSMASKALDTTRTATPWP